MEANDFVDWLHGGENVCVYHTGSSKDTSPEERLTFGCAWDAAVNRQVYLFQRRRNGVLEYIAVRSKGRVPKSLAPRPKEANDNQITTKQRSAA